LAQVSTTTRIVLHLAEGLREVLDADDVYFFEAAGGDTRVRLRGRRVRKDVRQLGVIAKSLGKKGFFRISRDHLVNLNRVRYLRRQTNGAGWEVKLEPPVNAVLPVGRRSVAGLTRALES